MSRSKPDSSRPQPLLGRPVRQPASPEQAQLDKSAYPAWFAGLFNAFADAMDTGELESSLRDIGNVASVLEGAYDAARTGIAQDIAPA